MSKYNKGDRFIVEVKEVMESENGTLYRSDFSTLTFDDYGLDKLQKCEDKTATELEDEAFEQGVNEGLEMVWKLIKKIGRMSSEDMDKVFGKKFFYTTDIIENMTPQEVLAKLEAYEKEQAEIKVGDVVELTNNEHTYCITYISPNNNVAGVCIETGTVIPENYDVNISQCKKTGKHIDIASILAEIGKE